ncbi:MAG: hypothetical protein JNL43_15605 [Flavobacteriales bacterium]|nr:hypothetical protein [Flavobacteriales bacterium]HRH67882.1 hypothetical protein [Flavobacteriales bacterium]
MRQVTRFMEHFWLAVAIGTGLAAIWVIINEGFAVGSQWLWFPGIALAMFFFRRFTRAKLEAMDDREQERRK